MEAWMTGTAGLWLAVLLSGIYHGVNPGMGWPLAVSSALMEFDPSRRSNALLRALGALSVGHFLAMLGILLPFSLMLVLAEYERPIRIGAGFLVIALGLWILITKRHPRFLARVPPSRLALWSFLVALAHGAALMLVPIYLGLCATDTLDAGHRAAETLMRNAWIGLVVASVHTIAMMASGGALAWGVYRWLGLGAIRKSWLDLERIWALSLVLVGAIAVWTAL
jgi:hypothetical protein